jgi:hypothetical protein
MGDCVARLNDDLARIHRWSMSNVLLLNPNKTKAMFICRSRADDAPRFLFGVSCFEWLILLVCANLRLLSIIVYGFLWLVAL